jgi:hypothetical protein
MLQELRSHLSYANVTATIALFVALGGTTYAATGGNFIPGQTNSASSSTQLSSGASGSALKVTNTGSGRGVAGFSNSGQGIYGHSNGNAGLVGESTSFDGVYGASNGSGAGVSGHNTTGSGWGVFGGATGGIGVGGYSDTWQGVYGHSNSNAGVVGESQGLDGVYGASHGNTGAAVSAHNDAGGTGVLADSSSGWAVQALGKAKQNRTGGGFVKAMAYLDPVNQASDPIRQCFNSQLSASQATNGNCGITFSRGSMAAGDYVLDFGFEVDDRLVLLTTSSVGLSGEWRRTMSVRGGTANTDLRVWAYDSKTDGFADTPFYIFVF